MNINKKLNKLRNTKITTNDIIKMTGATKKKIDEIEMVPTKRKYKKEPGN